MCRVASIYFGVPNFHTFTPYLGPLPQTKSVSAITRTEFRLHYRQRVHFLRFIGYLILAFLKHHDTLSSGCTVRARKGPCEDRNVDLSRSSVTSPSGRNTNVRVRAIVARANVIGRRSLPWHWLAELPRTRSSHQPGPPRARNLRDPDNYFILTPHVIAATFRSVPIPELIFSPLKELPSPDNLFASPDEVSIPNCNSVLPPRL